VSEEPRWADFSHRAKYCLTGPDRVRYLNGQVTNHIGKLREGESCAALVCNHRGRLEGEVVVQARDGALWLDGPAELRESLFARLTKYLIADDCELTDVTEAWAIFHEVGVTPGVLRIGPAGRDTWAPAGTAAPGPTLPATEIIRRQLAHHLPVWDFELTPDVLPHEVGLETTAVDFHKGCYVGQEVISRVETAGKTARLLVSLEAAGEALAPVGLQLLSADGTTAGTLGRSAFLAAENKTIALALVKRTLATPGTRLHLANDATAWVVRPT
jgi:tRNA-modifying protein YgfZ